MSDGKLTLSCVNDCCILLSRMNALVLYLVLSIFLVPTIGTVCNDGVCDDFVWLDRTPDPPDEVSKMNIAIITAGSIRSFAYVERSWRRYILEPWMAANVHVFAHVTSSSRTCEIFEKGIDAMKKLATELEISYSRTTILTRAEVTAMISPIKTCVKKLKSDNSSKGNIVDMHARRNRAYQMSMSYAKQHRLKWDIMMFVRPDSAFYSPKIEFYKIKMALQNHSEVTGNRSLIIPPACSFGHYCDRSAIGFPEEMGVYFNKSLLFEVANWAVVDDPADSADSLEDKRWIRVDPSCSDERMMKVWLQTLNGIQAAETYPPAASFITLRSRAGSLYCRSSRLQLKQNRGANWVDKMTMRWSNTGGFDTAIDPLGRCGPVHALNSTLLCGTPECSCIASDGW